MLSDDVLSATVPPSPSNMDEAARWEHTRLRRRLLSGHWEEDVRRRVRLRVGDTRSSAWGIDKPGGVDLSGNLFSQVSGDLSTLYNRPPIWSSSLDPNGARTVAETLQAAGWVSMMQRVERDTLGCREYLLKVEPRIGGGVVLRPVVPDFVEALADPIERDMPIRIDEWQLRDIGGRIAWTRTRTDARDGTVRVYSATGDDISDEIGETWRDEWYDSSGSPVLPYILYHAQRTGYLWDPWEGIGLVEGTLTNSVNLTHLQHAITQAANPQRYMAGLEPIGEALEDVSGRAPRRVVMSDPAVILQFDRIHGFDGQPMVGQFEPGADIGVSRRRPYAGLGRPSERVRGRHLKRGTTGGLRTVSGRIRPIGLDAGSPRGLHPESTGGEHSGDWILRRLPKASALSRREAPASRRARESS